MRCMENKLNHQSKTHVALKAHLSLIHLWKPCLFVWGVSGTLFCLHHQHLISWSSEVREIVKPALIRWRWLREIYKITCVFQPDLMSHRGRSAQESVWTRNRAVNNLWKPVDEIEGTKHQNQACCFLLAFFYIVETPTYSSC